MTNLILAGWTKERFLADTAVRQVARAHLQWQRDRTIDAYTSVSQALFVQGNDHLFELFCHVPQEWIEALKEQEKLS